MVDTGVPRQLSKNAKGRSHVDDASHGIQKLPPQSMPVSSPFWIPSKQDTIVESQGDAATKNCTRSGVQSENSTSTDVPAPWKTVN